MSIRNAHTTHSTLIQASLPRHQSISVIKRHIVFAIFCSDPFNRTYIHFTTKAMNCTKQILRHTPKTCRIRQLASLPICQPHQLSPSIIALSTNISTVERNSDYEQGGKYLCTPVSGKQRRTSPRHTFAPLGPERVTSAHVAWSRAAKYSGTRPHRRHQC